MFNVWKVKFEENMTYQTNMILQQKSHTFKSAKSPFTSALLQMVLGNVQR